MSTSSYFTEFSALVNHNNKLVNITLVADCFDISVDEAIVTIGMNADIFEEFGPIVSDDSGMWLNSMHLEYLVILLPTTDRMLPFKKRTARRLASTYDDESLGIVRETAKATPAC